MQNRPLVAPHHLRLAIALVLAAALGAAYAAARKAGLGSGTGGAAIRCRPVLAEGSPNHWVLGQAIGVSVTARTWC